MSDIALFSSPRTLLASPFCCDMRFSSHWCRSQLLHVFTHAVDGHNVVRRTIFYIFCAFWLHWTVAGKSELWKMGRRKKLMRRKLRIFARASSPLSNGVIIAKFVWRKSLLFFSLNWITEILIYTVWSSCTHTITRPNSLHSDRCGRSWPIAHMIADDVWW